VLGLFAGAAFAHNFSLASTPAGPSSFGTIAVIAGLLVALSLGFVMRESVPMARNSLAEDDRGPNTSFNLRRW